MHRKHANFVLTIIPFTPFIIIFICIVALYSYFLRSYDTGLALPSTYSAGDAVAANPDTDPATPPALIEIADTNNLPQKMNALPTPKQSLTSHAVLNQHPAVSQAVVPAAVPQIPAVAQIPATQPAANPDANGQVLGTSTTQPDPNATTPQVPPVPPTGQ